MSCFFNNYEVIKYLTTLDTIYNYSPGLELGFELLSFYPSITLSDYVSGRITGLDLYRGLTDLFEPGCFQSGCMTEPGSWSEFDEQDIVPDYSNSSLFSSDCFVSGCWDSFSHACQIKEYYAESPNICVPDYSLVGIDTECIGYSPVLDDYFEGPNPPNVSNFNLGYYIYLSNRYRQYITKLDTYYSGSLEGDDYVERGTGNEKYFITYQHMFGSECYTNVPTPMGVLNLYFIGDEDPILLASFSPDTSIVCKYNEDYSFNNKNYSSLLFIGSLAVRHEIAFLKSENVLNISTILYKDCSSYVSPRVLNYMNRNYLYKDDSGLRLLWYPGALDYLGNSYVVDIGYINDRYSDVGSITYYDYNVPINSNGEFVSTTKFIDGVLAIRLKRVTKLNVSILRVFIYPLDIHLMRTYHALGSKERDNYYTNLEALSLSLIQIMLSGYLEPHKCVERRGFWYLESYLEDVLKEEYDLLYRLMDNVSQLKYISRYSSIPLRLSVFALSEPIYDDRYFPSLSRDLFVDYLFEDNCFGTCIMIPGSDREVSNRALAWLLYSLATYRKVFPNNNNNKYLIFLNRIANYLIMNIDHRYRLTYRGWTHNDVYSYSELVDDFPTSTSVVTCLALLKAYDITKEVTFLEVGTDLYQGIMNYLYLPEMQVCAHSLDVDGISLDSLLHSLWLFLELNNAPLVEKVLKLLLIRLKPRDNIPYYSSVYYEDSLGNRSEVVHDSISIITQVISNLIDDIIPFYTIDEDFINPINDDLYQYIYLSILSHRLNESLPSYMYESLPIEIINYFKHKLSDFDCKNNSFHSLIRTNILNQNLLFGHPLFNIECLESVNTLISSRKYIYNLLKGSIPTRFGWFSRSALLPSGNLGKLLLAFSKALSPSVVFINRLIEFFPLGEAKGILLDERGNEIDMPRFSGETNEEYIDRVNKFTNLSSGTRLGLQNLLSLYKINSSISRRKVLTTSFPYLPTYSSEIYSDDISIGYLYSESTHDDEFIVTDMNLPFEVLDPIENRKGIGVAPSFITVNSIFSCHPEVDSSLYITPPSTEVPTYTSSLICSSDCYNIYNLRLDYPFPQPMYINVDDQDNIFLTLTPEDTSIDLIIPPNTQKVVMLKP